MPRSQVDIDFEELERAADMYAHTWWLQPDSPARQFLEDHPEMRPALNQRLLQNLSTQTVDVYAIGSKRKWDESRVVLHRDLLADLDAADESLLDGPDAFVEDPENRSDTAGGDIDDANDDATENVYFVLGLPGSGKTKVLRRLAERHAAGDATRVGGFPASDADEVRVKLPEYADGVGSGVVQAETVVVTYGEAHLVNDGRQDRVLARGGAAVVDVIGDPTHLPRTVRLLAAAGRQCFVLLTDCPVAVCQDRAKRRAVESGRLVPLWLIEEKAGVPRAALDAALATKLVAGWAVVDTSGDAPELVDGDGVFDNCLSGLAAATK